MGDLNFSPLGRKISAELKEYRRVAHAGIVPLSEEELRRFLASMGQLPVLTTEDPKAFEELFLSVARRGKCHDFLSLHLAWEITIETWLIRRYHSHGTISIDRRARANVAQETAKLNKDSYENDLAEKTKRVNPPPHEVVEMANLQKKVEETVVELEAIEARETTAIDINRAIQAKAGLLQNFDHLCSGPNRRRHSNFILLDRYNAGFNPTAPDQNEVVDAEFQEVDGAAMSAQKAIAESAPKMEAGLPTIALSPSVIAAKSEISNDIAAQDRSESAQ